MCSVMWYLKNKGEVHSDNRLQRSCLYIGWNNGISNLLQQDVSKDLFVVKAGLKRSLEDCFN